MFTRRKTANAAAWLAPLLVALSIALLATASLAPAAFADEAASGQQGQSAAVLSLGAGSSSSSQASLEDGAVYLISTTKAAEGTMVVDVKGGSTAAGANVQLYKYNATLAQFWRAVHKGGGVYNFVSVKGGKLLSWTRAAKTANVRTASAGNADWKVFKNADGSFSLAPASATSLRMDIALGKTAKGTNVWLHNNNGTAAQKFYFQKMNGLTQAFQSGAALDASIVSLPLASNGSLSVGVAGESVYNGARAQLAATGSARSQRFILSSVGNGLYELVFGSSGKLLDVAGGSRQAGAAAQQYRRNHTVAQYWYFIPSGSGYELRSAASGLSLTAAGVQEGAKLVVGNPSASQTQVFRVAASQLVADGTYVIQSSIITPMVLDVKGASTANGANVQIFRSNGTAAQQFVVKHVGGGAYTIQNAKSGKYLDVAWGSVASGANVWTYAGNGTDAQKWLIELVDGGELMLRSVKSGKYLDVAGAKGYSGTNVRQATGNGGVAQRWVLHEASWKFYPSSTSLSDLRVMNKAHEYEGWPYKWGGRSPSTSFDCAGLVMYCSNKVWGTNFDLVYTNADRLYKMCTPLNADQAKVGDLVFYRGTYGSDVNYISHVVFYAGQGIMYGAGDPIGYGRVDSIKNIKQQPAQYMFARIKH